MFVKLITAFAIFPCFSSIDSVNGSCNFEEDFCGWSDINWVRTRYKSPYTYSGPQQASKSEYYIYFDPLNVEGATFAQLTTTTISTATENCLAFQYHMYGINVDKLEVNITGSNLYKILLIKENQGDTWKCMKVALHPYGDTVKVRFTAYGQDQYGVIALDDIRIFYSSSCPLDIQSSNGTCELNSELPTTVSTSVGIFSSVETVKTTTALTLDPFKDKLPYVVAVPAGVLILIIPIVLIAICIKRRKNQRKENALPYIEGQNVQRPSVTPSTRYPSLPHINPLEYETIPADHYYDSIKTPVDNYYITPIPSVYRKPLDSPMKDKPTQEDDYIELPAVTVGKGNKSSNQNQNPSSSVYRKKISISDQGNVSYSTHIEKSKYTPNDSMFNDYIDPL